MRFSNIGQKSRKHYPGAEGASTGLRSAAAGCRTLFCAAYVFTQRADPAAAQWSTGYLMDR